jgi:hypothetical protein
VAVVALFIFSVYAVGACRSIYVGDSGELVTARIGWRFPAEEYPPGLRWWVPVNFTNVGLVAILALSLFYFAYILFAPSRAEAAA